MSALAHGTQTVERRNAECAGEVPIRAAAGGRFLQRDAETGRQFAGVRKQGRDPLGPLDRKSVV